MAKNDLEVIIYKVLAYLYECMKAGVDPKEEDFCCRCRLFTIPQSYWNYVMKILRDEGFATGIIYSEGAGVVFVDASSARITLKGVEYLSENSGMKTAAEFAGAAFEILLSSVIDGVVRATVR